MDAPAGLARPHPTLLAGVLPSAQVDGSVDDVIYYDDRPGRSMSRLSWNFDGDPDLTITR
jgi:hypothetical protein